MEEMDKALHDVITTIWQAYRKDCKTFNSCFAGLYEKYPDNKLVENLIIGMGLGLAPAVRAKVKEMQNDKRKSIDYSIKDC